MSLDTDVGVVNVEVRKSGVGDRSHLGRLSYSIGFVLPNCVGEAYYQDRPRDGLVLLGGIYGPTNDLYADAGEPAAEVNWQSMYLPLSSTCTNLSAPYPYTSFRAALVLGSFYDAFPPPYRLEFRAVSSGPDLMVATLSTAPSSPTASAPTSIKVTTKNAGAETVGASKTRLYLSIDPAAGPEDAVLADFSVVALPPGGFRTHTVSVTLPAGTRYLIAVADVDDEQAESKETNNTKKVLKTVR